MFVKKKIVKRCDGSSGRAMPPAVAQRRGEELEAGSLGGQEVPVGRRYASIRVPELDVCREGHRIFQGIKNRSSRWELIT